MSASIYYRCLGVLKALKVLRALSASRPLGTTAQDAQALRPFPSLSIPQQAGFPSGALARPRA
jgi:hypothetical protein